MTVQNGQPEQTNNQSDSSGDKIVTSQRRGPASSKQSLTNFGDPVVKKAILRGSDSHLANGYDFTISEKDIQQMRDTARETEQELFP